MELVSRILDGSILYSARGEPLGPSFYRGRVTQDDRIERLEEVNLLAGCSRKQLRGRARHNKAVNFEGTAAAGEFVEVEITSATSQTLIGHELLLSRV